MSRCLLLADMHPSLLRNAIVANAEVCAKAEQLGVAEFAELPRLVTAEQP